jgi:hypothetical protein
MLSAFFVYSTATMMVYPFPTSILIVFLFFALVHSQGPTSDTYRSNKGPLTTQFVPPSTCLSEVRTRNRFGYHDLELGCEGPGGNECCPAGWGWKRYFSPGVCPSGYQTCKLPSSIQRQETTNVCCPEYVLPINPRGVPIKLLFIQNLLFSPILISSPTVLKELRLPKSCRPGLLQLA